MSEVWKWNTIFVISAIVDPPNICSGPQCFWAQRTCSELTELITRFLTIFYQKQYFSIKFFLILFPMSRGVFFTPQNQDSWLRCFFFIANMLFYKMTLKISKFQKCQNCPQMTSYNTIFLLLNQLVLSKWGCLQKNRAQNIKIWPNGSHFFKTNFLSFFFWKIWYFSHLLAS